MCLVSCGISGSANSRYVLTYIYIGILSGNVNAAVLVHLSSYFYTCGCRSTSTGCLKMRASCGGILKFEGQNSWRVCLRTHARLERCPSFCPPTTPSDCVNTGRARTSRRLVIRTKRTATMTKAASDHPYIHVVQFLSRSGEDDT